MKKLGSLATHWAHSEDSDQTGRMPRLIWVFAGRTVILWFCPEAAQITYEQSFTNFQQKLTEYNNYAGQCIICQVTWFSLVMRSKVIISTSALVNIITWTPANVFTTSRCRFSSLMQNTLTDGSKVNRGVFQLFTVCQQRWGQCHQPFIDPEIRYNAFAIWGYVAWVMNNFSWLQFLIRHIPYTNIAV